MRITQTEAMRQIRAMGLTVSRTQYNELRINLHPDKGGTVDTAYYATDAGDAVETARQMLIWSTNSPRRAAL